jgi:hypothetical protein
MESNYKASIASRASVRSLIIAFMPATAVALVANSSSLGAAFIPSDQGLTFNNNTAASTNGPSTNGSPANTNRDILPCFGLRG